MSMSSPTIASLKTAAQGGQGGTPKLRADSGEQAARPLEHRRSLTLAEATSHALEERPCFPGALLLGEELGQGRGRAELEQERVLPAGYLDPAPQARFRRARSPVAGEME